MTKFETTGALKMGKNSNGFQTQSKKPKDE